MRSKYPAIIMASVLFLLYIPISNAAESQELLELRNTILNLVDELVAQGVFSSEKAAQMKAQATIKARDQAAQASIAAGEVREEAPALGAAPAGQPVLRVPYVPEFVKDDIRDQVREELAADVTKDVVAVARAEKWGTPDALPDWISNIKLSGDMRLRYLGLFTEKSNNQQIPNLQKINSAGGAGLAGQDAFLNTTEDLHRAQVRARIGLVALMSDNFSFGVRLATGNVTNPISRNQTLGNYNSAFDMVIDQAYLQWQSDELWGKHALALRGGRVPNPFVYTPLVWDDDLTMDGLTAAYSGPLFGDSRYFTNLGGFTLLAMEANKADSSANMKYWWGGQLGFDLNFSDKVSILIAGAYYDFIDVTGEMNDFQSNSKDWTAPAFIVKGNTVYDIRNDLDPNTNLFALASEFKLWNATTEFDWYVAGPVHFILRGDYVQNSGFDRKKVSSRTGADVMKRNEGWLADLKIGWPSTTDLGQWQVFGGYRKLQRDAVIDAFTDSDFHAGGTDSEGWHVGVKIGFARNAWLRARWLSANEIDGAPAGFTGADKKPVEFSPLGIDVVQVDLNAKF